VAFLFGLSILWETLIDGKSVSGLSIAGGGPDDHRRRAAIMIGIVGEYIGRSFRS